MFVCVAVRDMWMGRLCFFTAVLGLQAKPPSGAGRLPQPPAGHGRQGHLELSQPFQERRIAHGRKLHHSPLPVSLPGLLPAALSFAAFAVSNAAPRSAIHLRPSCPCSPPGVTAAAVDAVTGLATITPPSEGAPWESYELKACISPSDAECATVVCPANANQTAQTECLITSRSPRTLYYVVVTALRPEGARTPPSLYTTFQTPAVP